MKSLILETTASLLVVLLALFSIFMLLRGHQDPGGGFVGGLILASALALFALGRDAGAARKLLGVVPQTLIGLGLLVAFASAAAGLLVKGNFFTPLLGPSVAGLGKLGTPLLFDLAVYMLVAGAVIEILLTLAED